MMRTFSWARGYELADGLQLGHGAGLLHLRTISEIVGRKIRVWDKEGKILGIYDGNLGADIELIEYEIDQSCKLCNIDDCLEVEYQASQVGANGHWKVKNYEDITKEVNNNCLFNSVCRQIQNLEPNRLREIVADVIRLKEIVLEENFPQFPGSGKLLLGGAKYSGTDPSHAREILDNSQGTRGHGHVARAHPRGHASHAEATGSMDSVEKYSSSSSRDFPKSAWLSRNDQDESMHRLLLTNEVQQGMMELNRGGTRVVIKMTPNFQIRMGLWAEGVMFCGPIIAEKVTILLQHHEGRYQDTEAHVQVFTCYPVNEDAMRNPSQYPTANIPVTLRLPLVSSPSETSVDAKRIKLSSCYLS